MNYKPKKCHFCHSSDIRKHGIRNNIQRYKCNACNKTFTLKKKLNPISIWNDYSIGKQTYKQLAEKYHCSIKTIQKYIEKAPKTVLNPPQSRYLNIIADTTFFGREFGILVLMDSLSKKVVYLFTYEKYGDLNIEKTTNRLENLFGQLKEKISHHAGLTKKHKIMFIKNFLNKKSC